MFEALCLQDVVQTFFLRNREAIEQAANNCRRPWISATQKLQATKICNEKIINYLNEAIRLNQQKKCSIFRHISRLIQKFLASYPDFSASEDRSNHVRLDGGLCFEIPSWQLQPVDVENHLDKIKNTIGNSNSERRQNRDSKLSLVNREVKRYVDTVIAPFLDTYHVNIQNSYHQLSNKILKRIKEEMTAALRKKQKIYTELTNLAESLKVPVLCNEELRAARTLASKHVSLIYKCTEQARESIAKMRKYAEEMIGITRRHMELALSEVAKKLDKKLTSKFNITLSLEDLSHAAVLLGYELDLSLTNARRHNEQSCEKLFSCSIKARKTSDELVQKLKEYLYHCVYA